MNSRNAQVTAISSASSRSAWLIQSINAERRDEIRSTCHRARMGTLGRAMQKIQVEDVLRDAAARVRSKKATAKRRPASMRHAMDMFDMLFASISRSEPEACLGGVAEIAS